MRWPSIYLSKQQNHSTSHRVVPRDQMNGWQKKMRTQSATLFAPHIRISRYRSTRFAQIAGISIVLAGWPALGFSLPPSRF